MSYANHCKHCDPECTGHLNPGWHKFDLSSLAWNDDYGCPICAHVEILREMAREAEFASDLYLKDESFSKFKSELYSVQADILHVAADRIELGEQ